MSHNCSPLLHLNIRSHSYQHSCWIPLSRSKQIISCHKKEELRHLCLQSSCTTIFLTDVTGSSGTDACRPIGVQTFAVRANKIYFIFDQTARKINGKLLQSAFQKSILCIKKCKIFVNISCNPGAFRQSCENSQFPLPFVVGDYRNKLLLFL